MPQLQLRICIAVVVTSISLVGCGSRTQRIDLSKGAPQRARVNNGSVIWKSEHFPVEFTWKPPWRYMKTTDAVDSHERLRAPFRDPESMSFLVAEITPDVSTEQLSDSAYLSAVKEQQLGAAGMEFIDEGPCKVFDIDYHRLRFSTDGEKGPQAVHAFVRRDGKTSLILQAIFPVSKREDAKAELPNQFELLNIKAELQD
jgi:hypothetical protein